MRDSLLVLPANVLQVKQVSGGDGHRRIVLCTTKNVGWPDKKSVNGLRADLAARIPGIKLASITVPMKPCKEFNIWLVIDLGTSVSERKAGWIRFEAQRVASDKRSFATKHASPHKGKEQLYVDRHVAIASAA